MASILRGVDPTREMSNLNIALMNELAIIFNRLGLDTIEVLEAAGTKWNFLPFRPGLVGGHCIGVDPYYLTHRAEKIGYHSQVILAGRRINDGMGIYVAQQTVKHMIDSRRFPQGISCPVGRRAEFENDQAGLPGRREVETGLERTEEGGRGGVEALSCCEQPRQEPFENAYLICIMHRGKVRPRQSGDLALVGRLPGQVGYKGDTAFRMICLPLQKGRNFLDTVVQQ